MYCLKLLTLQNVVEQLVAPTAQNEYFLNTKSSYHSTCILTGANVIVTCPARWNARRKILIGRPSAANHTMHTHSQNFSLLARATTILVHSLPFESPCDRFARWASRSGWSGCTLSDHNLISRTWQKRSTCAKSTQNVSSPFWHPAGCRGLVANQHITKIEH